MVDEIGSQNEKRKRKNECNSSLKNDIFIATQRIFELVIEFRVLQFDLQLVSTFLTTLNPFEPYVNLGCNQFTSSSKKIVINKI